MIDIAGAGSRKVNRGGDVVDEFHRSQVIPELVSKLMGFGGVVGFRVLAKLTVYF